MTTPTLSTAAALRRAVCIDPHDDTARLVLADALDESGGEMEAKWAELIRVGCELAAIPDPPPEPSVGMRSASRSQRLAALHIWSMQWKAKYYTLRARESALRDELTPWLRRGERCERCKGKGSWQTGPHGEECRACHGIGWLGSLADVPEDRITITRGLVSRVELTVEQVQDADFLRRLFSEWPVTEAGLVGREPYWDEVVTSAAIVARGRKAAGLPQIGDTP